MYLEGWVGLVFFNLNKELRLLLFISVLSEIA